MKRLFTLCLVLLSIQSFSQNLPELVKDLNTGEVSAFRSDAGSMIFVDSILYFQGFDGINGLELWKTDGTAGGTELVKDIFPGIASGGSRDFVNANGTLYFIATDTNGTELWKSDGTKTGTVMVRNLSTGSGSSTIEQLVAKGDSVYFVGIRDGSFERDLYVSDGTSAGTQKVKDIRFPGNDDVRNIVEYKNEIYFTAFDGTETELWKTDGSAAGTSMLDIISGTSGLSFPKAITQANGLLFFQNSNSGQTEMIATDGTQLGTSVVGTYSNRIENVTVGDTALYYTHLSRPWISNGTVTDTRVVDSNFYASELFYHRGELYFAGDSLGNSSIGQELWKNDGTSTTLLKDIYPGFGINFANSGSPRGFTSVDSTLFFAAVDDSLGFELWKTDGSANGTELVLDINAGKSSGLTSFGASLIAGNGELFFAADEGINDLGLWKSDGTANGTEEFFNPFVGTQGSGISELIGYNDKIFFSADGPWISDGTPGGTVKASFGIDQGVKLLGEFYVSSSSDSTGNELWKIDGSGTNRTLVKNIAFGQGSSQITSLTVSDSLIYFAARQDNSTGLELWKSNGTDTGTVLVKNIFTGFGNSSIANNSPNFVDVDGTLFFTATNGTDGYELWKSDGSDTGTVMVKDINLGSLGSFPGDLTNVDGTLFFSANDGLNGIELWKSDGTSVGTVLVKDIQPGVGGSMTSSFSFKRNSLVDVNGTLYFTANDGTNGVELWKSDGTAFGTNMVKDVGIGGASFSIPSYLIPYKEDTLFFTAKNNTELWRSDGSISGTVLVKKINALGLPRNPNFTIYADTVYFKADDGTNGLELWKSDGTESGTKMVANIGPGSQDGLEAFVPMLVEASSLFFIADDGFTGEELWRLGPCLTTRSVDVIAACDSLTWMNGVTYYANNFTATDTLVNAGGCDSVITLNLTINNNTGIDTIVACDSYQWIDGVTYTANNNIALDTLVNVNGCDSIIRLELTILNSTAFTDTISACDSITWIDGITYTASNTSATDTLINAAGCDSIVSLNLTILNSTTGVDVVSSCESYTWIDGITYTASNNTATDTLTNAAGCDSLVSLDLTILNPTTSSDVQVACESYTWINGITYTSSNNTATDTLVNAVGCDSIIQLDLTVNNPTSGIDQQTACDSFIWINGVTYTANNNTATDTLIGSNGCDSIVTLDLTINTVDTSVTRNGDALDANVFNASYQWLDCNNGFSIINGATNQQFIPTQSGSYAVEITLNSCTDTSTCFVTSVGLSEVSLDNRIEIYPNPSKEFITIKTDVKLTEIAIINVNGKIIQTEIRSDYKVNLEGIPAGLYFIQLNTSEGLVNKRFVKID